MFKLLFYTILFSGMVCFLSCNQTVHFVPQAFDDKTYLSDQKFDPYEMIMLKDNDLAFASKIDIIRKAKSQVCLIYYIIEPDESSAYLVETILNKISSNKDFKVKILTDYHYNYKNLDFFRWLENQQPNGIQQVEVRFYNRPTVNVIKFAEYMTLGCEDAIESDTKCSEAKVSYLEKFDSMSIEEAESAMSVPAKIFLSGLYSKNPFAMMYGIQAGYYNTIQSMESEEGMSRPEIDEKQKKQLIQIAQLYWKSKTSKGMERFSAKLKLGAIGLFAGKKIEPVLNSFETFLPFSVTDIEGELLMSNPDMDYLTDFTHHKFILGDQTYVQIGGRNMANAYNMHPNPSEDKYIFMDTDVFLHLDESGGYLFQTSFDELWNFEDMVASTSDIARHAPIEYLYLIEKLDTLVSKSCKEGDPIASQICAGGLFLELLNSGLENFTKEKQEKWERVYEENLNDYKNNYLLKTNSSKSWTNLIELFDIENGFCQDVKSMIFHDLGYYSFNSDSIYYIENLPFSRSMSANERSRKYGSYYGKELEYGKSIHKVWEDALQDACHKSLHSSETVEVIFHQGYFSPPEGLAHHMNQIIQSINCPNLRVKVYTNSINSTDLVPINFIGRRMLLSMNQNNQELVTNRFEYFEYDKVKLDSLVKNKYYLQGEDAAAGTFSLHSKVMIFDDDIYIGSANADFRSYLMDTNNGIFIQEVPELVDEYKDFLNELELSGVVYPAKSEYEFPSVESLGLREQQEINFLLDKYNLREKFSETERIELLNNIKSLMDEVSDLYNAIMKEGKINNPSALDALLKTI